MWTFPPARLQSPLVRADRLAEGNAASARRTVARTGGRRTVVEIATAVDDVSPAWPAEQAEEALRRIVTVILHSRGPLGIREMAVLCLACDALGIDEPVLVMEPEDQRPVAVVPGPRSLLVG